MAKLMIIESPGKLKKLRAILGSGWNIQPSVGHIRDLPATKRGQQAWMPQGPDFRAEYELTDRGRGVVADLKKAVRDADEVYLATDPDREGEAISWHLQQALGLRESYHRVAFNEITEKAVKAALSKPRRIDMGLVRAQESRRVLDRLVGYMASPVLWQGSSVKGLSAGRVQSPAVRLVVDREREIRAFKVTNHFGVKLKFEGGWQAEWNTRPFTTEESPYVTDRILAEAVSKVRDVLVESFKEGPARRGPPPPFTTSSLQQAASNKLRLNPKTAMDIAQKLYEGGHITYHRTDNPNLSEDSMADVAAALSTRNVGCVDKQRRYPAPEGSQAGHPAITPTHWEVESAGDTPEQRALYDLIRTRALACQAPDAEYATRQAVLTSNTADGKAVHFEAKGRTLTKSGWLALLEGDDTEDRGRDAEHDNPVPTMKRGDSRQAKTGELESKKTQPPARYTEASLIKKLEKEGIGRPSTYAAIMENITSKGLVAFEKGKLVPTSNGEYVVDALVGKCQFMEIPYTKGVEGQLDQVADGKTTYLNVVGGAHAQLSTELKGVNLKQASQPDSAGHEVICPGCGKSMGRRTGKNGAFWGCSGYPECKVTLEDKRGKPMPKSPAALPHLSTEFCCADQSCGKPLVRRPSVKETNTFWWGCSGYKDGCRETYADRDGKPYYELARGSRIEEASRTSGRSVTHGRSR